MTTRVVKEGNVTTTVVDMTNGVGGRTAEEILALTGGGKTREYTETRPDGSTVTYTIDVEEEEYEEEVEMEITTTRTVKTMEYMMEGQGGGRTMEIIREGGRGGEMAITRSSATISGAGEGGEMTKTKSGGSMVGPREVTSMRQESEMDMQTIEEPPRSRRASQQRSGGLPPARPMRPPVPDLTEVHGPLYPTERRHEFPRDPPPRVESKAKDDFKFPVMVEDGKHSCTEACSIHPTKS